ncbi:helix-turn-helix domain-containing protein [Candidatus Pacearchaeota archaeon]|nr:helix-turn-helix domain-containing protein [Candidatus Pacearchaeota archaeon]
MKAKTKEKEECRILRKRGLSVRKIAEQIGVSKGSVSTWVRDINLSNDQIEKLKMKSVAGRKNSEAFRDKRRQSQEKGRKRIQKEDKEYSFGCALFWGEGNKCKNQIRLTNSDPKMLAFFVNFLHKYFKISDDSITFNFQYYLNNGLTFEDIVSYWSNQLGLPKKCLRKCTLKSQYYSNSKIKHPYGIGSICVGNTDVVHQLYGSIKEMVNDNSDKWLF